MKRVPERGSDDDTATHGAKNSSERRRALHDHRMPGDEVPGEQAMAPKPKLDHRNMGNDGEKFPRRMDDESKDRPGAAAPVESFDTLKKAALSNPDPEERVRAVESMSFFEDEQALGVLSVALTDNDAEVRMAALEEISIISENPPLPLLETALRDSDAEMRETALRMLSDSEDEARWPLIKAALQDPDEDVRSEAEDIVEMESDEADQ